MVPNFVPAALAASSRGPHSATSADLQQLPCDCHSPHSCYVSVLECAGRFYHRFHLSAPLLWTPQINARANRIANHLVSLGVRPGSIVGVLLLRSPNMVAALLGVLKAGAAYLPLDHHHPEERIALMLEDAGVQVGLIFGTGQWQ